MFVYLNQIIESMAVDVAFRNATLKEDVSIDPSALCPPVANGMVLRQVQKDTYPVHEVRRLAWEDWYTQFNNTLYDHVMNDYDADLWTYMTQMEWDFLFPREPSWRANWYQVSPELKDRLDRLN